MGNGHLEASRNGLKTLEKKVAALPDREQRLRIITEIRNGVEDVLARLQLITIDPEARKRPIGHSQVLEERTSAAETFLHFNKLYKKLEAAEKGKAPEETKKLINEAVGRVIVTVESKHGLRTKEKDPETKEAPFTREALLLFIDDTMKGNRQVMQAINMGNTNAGYEKYELLLDLLELVPIIDERHHDSYRGHKLDIGNISRLGPESRKSIKEALKGVGIHLVPIATEEAARFRQIKDGVNPFIQKGEIRREMLKTPLKTFKSLNQTYSPFGTTYYGALKSIGWRRVEDVLELKPAIVAKKATFTVRIKGSIRPLIAEQLAGRIAPKEVAEEIDAFRADLEKKLQSEGLPIRRQLEKDEVKAWGTALKKT